MSHKVEKTVLVTIRKDRPLTMAFLHWALDNRIYTLRNAGGSVGPDFVSQTYSAEHEAAILNFFKEQS